MYVFKASIFLVNVRNNCKIICFASNRKVSLCVMSSKHYLKELLKVLGKRRISTVADRYCLILEWPRLFHVPKSSLKALSESIIGKNFVTPVSLRTFSFAKFFWEDDIHILLNFLVNAYHLKFIWYLNKNQWVIVDTISPGRVESGKELGLFYFNKKYELILPFSETVERSKHPSYNEQFNGTFFLKNVLPLKHLQIQHSVVFLKASHIYMTIFNFLFSV